MAAARITPSPAMTGVDATYLGIAHNSACDPWDEHAQVAALPWNLAMTAVVDLSMRLPPINDPAYWRERAREARRIADELADAVAKQTMLEIARSYDNIATLTAAASKASK